MVNSKLLVSVKKKKDVAEAFGLSGNPAKVESAEYIPEYAVLPDPIKNPTFFGVADSLSKNSITINDCSSLVSQFSISSQAPNATIKNMIHNFFTASKIKPYLFTNTSRKFSLSFAPRKRL